MTTRKPKTKMLQVSEEFVKQAHDAAYPKWKTKIEEQFPNLSLNIFKPGNLVTRLDLGGLVILVTGKGRDENENFSGIVVVAGEYPVGNADEGWSKYKFQQYTGPKLDIKKILGFDF